MLKKNQKNAKSVRNPKILKLCTKIWRNMDHFLNSVLLRGGGEYAFISYQYKILSKFKKRIEFHGYFTHGLDLQRKIKAWSQMIVTSEPSLVTSDILCPIANRLHDFILFCRTNPWVKYPQNSIFF